MLELKSSDRAGFEHILGGMKAPAMPKEKVAEIAYFSCGSDYKTKPAALKAIRAKFDESAWQQQKSRANEKVTPW